MPIAIAGNQRGIAPEGLRRPSPRQPPLIVLAIGGDTGLIEGIAICCEFLKGLRTAPPNLYRAKAGKMLKRG
jgi:hypothetical protein